MPTNVRIMVQWEQPLTESELVPLREALCAELGLNREDDFYQDGPLRFVFDPNAHYDYALSNGQLLTPPLACSWFDTNICRAYYGPGYERGDFLCL